MGPDSGLAIAVFIAAFLLPGLALLLCVAAAVGLWLAGWRVASVVAALCAVGVVVVWFFAFGIEYMPRHTGRTLVVDEGVELVGVRFCADRGEPVVDGRIVVPPDGLARVREPEPEGVVNVRDWMTYDLEQGGIVRTVSADSYTGGGGGCTFVTLWLGDPMRRPLSAATHEELEALMAEQGLTLHQAVVHTQLPQ